MSAVAPDRPRMRAAALERDRALVVAHATRFAACFFAQLARQDAALAALFPPTAAARETLLRHLLAALCALAHDAGREPANPRIRIAAETLAHRHAALGVREEHFDTLGAALLVSLHVVLGDAAWADSGDDWAGVYGEMAEAMIAAGACGSAWRPAPAPR